MNTAVAGTVPYENESAEMTLLQYVLLWTRVGLGRSPRRIGSGLVFNRDITAVKMQRLSSQTIGMEGEP